MKLYNNILSDRYIYHGKLNKEQPYNNIITQIIELLKNSNSRKFRNFCPLCDNSEAYKISEKDRYNLPVTFLICSKCGFIFSQECDTGFVWVEDVPSCCGAPAQHCFFESDLRWMKHYGFMPFDVTSIHYGAN